MTSPDPDLHTDAREFFTRHMRLLETVMAAWPMPEMQRQVDAVREAFSANIRKPFVLKASFPYSSPVISNAATPPRSSPGYRGPMMDHSGVLGSQPDSATLVTQLSFSNPPITPPISAGPIDGKNASPMIMFSAGPNVSMPPALPITDAPAWNPSRIFEYVFNNRTNLEAHLANITTGNGTRLLVRPKCNRIPAPKVKRRQV
jgi:hypothetical protein